MQRYADVNANGLIDPQEWLVQSFPVTDGVRPMIGGVRNINVPGDEDGAVNSTCAASCASIRGLLPGAEQAVACVAEAGQDIPLRIELAVE